MLRRDTQNLAILYLSLIAKKLTLWAMSMETNAEQPVDIEQIMQEIRAEILAQRGLDAAVPTGGKRLPPEFYEHLYQAALGHDQIGVKLHVTPVKIPLIGPLIERLRQAVHQLVLFYVNQLAAEQVQVNRHLLQALRILSEELEKEAADAAAKDNGL
jgi:hypothetical protein